jgi:hypothetical protein
MEFLSINRQRIGQKMAINRASLPFSFYLACPVNPLANPGLPCFLVTSHDRRNLSSVYLTSSFDICYWILVIPYKGLLALVLPTRPTGPTGPIRPIRSPHLTPVFGAFVYSPGLPALECLSRGWLGLQSQGMLNPLPPFHGAL